MSRKQHVPKTGPVWHQSAEQATLAKKPRYNGFACGHGVHGSTKYCRAKEKRAWQKQLGQEGAPHEAPSFFAAPTAPQSLSTNASPPIALDAASAAPKATFPSCRRTPDKTFPAKLNSHPSELVVSSLDESYD